MDDCKRYVAYIVELGDDYRSKWFAFECNAQAHAKKLGQGAVVRAINVTSRNGMSISFSYAR